jgi:hypothetical protein
MQKYQIILTALLIATALVSIIVAVLSKPLTVEDVLAVYIEGVVAM